jgi:predicted metal-binding membrane protein
MLLPVAPGLMSLTWMLPIAVLGVAQKALPGRAAVDIPVALAIVGIGILIVVAPASIPGFTPPM